MRELSSPSRSTIVEVIEEHEDVQQLEVTTVKVVDVLEVVSKIEGNVLTVGRHGLGLRV